MRVRDKIMYAEREWDTSTGIAGQGVLLLRDVQALVELALEILGRVVHDGRVGVRVDLRLGRESVVGRSAVGRRLVVYGAVDDVVTARAYCVCGLGSTKTGAGVGCLLRCPLLLVERALSGSHEGRAMDRGRWTAGATREFELGSFECGSVRSSPDPRPPACPILAPA